MRGSSCFVLFYSDARHLGRSQMAGASFLITVHVRRHWTVDDGGRVEGRQAPSSPLAPCLSSCPHTARSRLTRPAARWTALLSPLSSLLSPLSSLLSPLSSLLSPLRPCGAKIQLSCSVHVCTCNLMRGISKHLSKSALDQKHSSSSFLGGRFHYFCSHRYLPT